jgi:hypothetical protein
LGEELELQKVAGMVIAMVIDEDCDEYSNKDVR